MYGSSTSKLSLNASVRDKEAVSYAWPSYRDKTHPQRWKESALCSNSAAASTQYVDKFGILKDKDLLVQPQPRKIAKISRVGSRPPFTETQTMITMQLSQS